MYCFKMLQELSIRFIISVNVLILCIRLLFEPKKPVDVDVDGTLPVRVGAPGLVDGVKVVAGVLAELFVQEGFHGFGDRRILNTIALQDRTGSPVGEGQEEVDVLKDHQ